MPYTLRARTGRDEPAFIRQSGVQPFAAHPIGNLCFPESLSQTPRCKISDEDHQDWDAKDYDQHDQFECHQHEKDLDAHETKTWSDVSNLIGVRGTDAPAALWFYAYTNTIGQGRQLKPRLLVKVLSSTESAGLAFDQKRVLPNVDLAFVFQAYGDEQLLSPPRFGNAKLG